MLFRLRALVNEGEPVSEVFPDHQASPGVGELELLLRLGERRVRYLLRLDRRAELSLGGEEGDWRIVEEVLWADEEVVHRFRDGHYANAFKEWVDEVWLLRLEPRRREASAARPDPDLLVSGENFVAWLMGHARRRGAMASVVAAARASLPGLATLAFERAGRERVLVATFAHGVQVDFDALSDGQRCLIVLHAVSVLVGHSCSMLLLDEPDSRVTPSEVDPLFRALRQRAEHAGVQIMVASHHPQLIDLLAADTPWEFVLDGGVATARPFEVDRSSWVSASRHLLLRAR